MSAGKRKHSQANFVHFNNQLWRETLASTSKNYQTGAARLLLELARIATYTNTYANTMSYVQLTSAEKWKYCQANFVHLNYKWWRETLANTLTNHQAGAYKLASNATYTNTDANTLIYVHHIFCWKVTDCQTDFVHLNPKSWRGTLANTSKPWHRN